MFCVRLHGGCFIDTSGDDLKTRDGAAFVHPLHVQTEYLQRRASTGARNLIWTVVLLSKVCDIINQLAALAGYFYSYSLWMLFFGFDGIKRWRKTKEMRGNVGPQS